MNQVACCMRQSCEQILKILSKFQINYPLCTIASTPRLPEHCIEYVKILLWSKENPFSNPGEDSIAIDGDDPQHITWIYEKAQERAKEVLHTQ